RKSLPEKQTAIITATGNYSSRFCTQVKRSKVKTAQRIFWSDKISNRITGGKWKILCITSDGRKYDNPRILAKQERKLKNCKDS
ncbi:MAG: hypothetical protein ACOCM4_11970, partial [Acetivibrio ethanolgignens]